ncbi:MAG: phosphomannomutase/phosphoglucomutase [Rhizobiaceae bacterium]|nr:phosphomannomutase/phosphoglucomutase [Rhizobiaceae bacterium]
MASKPVASLQPNSYAFETTALVKPSGFREYDARWWFGHPASDKAPELNLVGVQALGAGLGTLMRRLGVGPDIVVGHDFRSYSLSIKLALTAGLMAAGARVRDIGLALSPMAYFAQFHLDAPSVAMVTASHNENGWTGVKMGCARPLTFGPEEMAALRDIVLSGDVETPGGGSYAFVEGVRDAYLADVVRDGPIGRRLRVVAACGNGTAGAFAPETLERLGCDVIPLDVELDHSFPRYNPNPEDMQMLHAIRDKVLEAGADVGLGFDGDGDRCGVVDNEGNEIFADKIGVMLARDISSLRRGARFVVDVKSTGLFATDPVLLANGAATDYWKTGHSYIKRRVAELDAAAGFEKSGHFFFNPPIGRGYDDGLVTAIAICRMLDRNPGRSMADLYRALPETFGTPTMSPHCDDDVKYAVADKVTGAFRQMQAAGDLLAGHRIVDLVTVNGVRVVTDDGTWGLVRASSNKPELVVVVESPVSSARRRAMFEAVDAVLRRNPEVGAYNQTF